MTRAAHARRIAVAAAYGGGGVGALSALLTGVVIGQAMIARRTIPMVMSPPPRCDGRYGTEHSGPPINLVVLGDSSAAGYGADAPRNTLGALIAAGLAELLARQVDLRCLAIVGSESQHLPPQIERAVELCPDVAVICIGANDVTHRVKAPLAVRYLVEGVRALRAVGVQVVVGTCPDLGTIQPIQPPLRWLARRWSRQMAAAQTIATVEAGGWTVSLGDLLRPAFEADPGRMFSPDRFHPSADGYAAAAAALLPTIVAALTEPEPMDQAPVPAGDGVRTLPEAAVEAVHIAGTEVSGAQVAGHERGPAGRWAELRHRVWRRTQRPTDPQATGTLVVGQSVADRPAGQAVDRAVAGSHVPLPRETIPVEKT